MLLIEAHELWARVGIAAPDTVIGYKRSLVRWARHGLVSSDDCTGPVVAAVMDERLKTCCARTVNSELNAILAVAAYAARRDPSLAARLESLQALRLPVTPATEPPKSYTASEWAALFATAATIKRPWLPRALALSCLAGTRRNETRTLHGEDVSMERRLITVQRRGSRRLKTRGSFRVISICPDLQAILAREPILPGPLFPGRDRDGYVSIEAWKRGMVKLQKASGIHATYNNGRHSFVTWGYEAQIPEPEMIRAAGHIDGEMIRKHYYSYRVGYVPAFDRLKPSG